MAAVCCSRRLERYLTALAYQRVLNVIPIISFPMRTAQACPGSGPGAAVLQTVRWTFADMTAMSSERTAINKPQTRRSVDSRADASSSNLLQPSCIECEAANSAMLSSTSLGAWDRVAALKALEALGKAAANRL